MTDVDEETVVTREIGTKDRLRDISDIELSTIAQFPNDVTKTHEY